MGKREPEKPNYDFSYIKKISSSSSKNEGEHFYDEVNDILLNFEGGFNIDGASKIISLLEKGCQTYLLSQNKIQEFFGSKDYKPNLSEMVLTNKQINKECEAFLKEKFNLNYKLISDLRNTVENPKNKIYINTLYLRKREILAQIFAFFVTLNKLLNDKEEAMPSHEFLLYYASFESLDEQEKRKKLLLAEEAFLNAEYDIAARYHALFDNQKMVDFCLRLFSLKILFQNLKSDLMSKRDFVLAISKYSRKEFNIVKKHFEPFELIVEMNEEHKRVSDLYNNIKITLPNKDTKFFVKTYNSLQKDEDKLGYLKLKMPEILRLFDSALLNLLHAESTTLKDVKSIARLKNTLFNYRIIEYCHENIDLIDDEYLGFVKTICTDEKLKELFQNEQIKRLIDLTNNLFDEKQYDTCLEKIIQLNPMLDAHDRSVFATMRVECMYHLRMYQDLVDLCKKDFYKSKICEFLKSIIYDDADIKREINNFRNTELEAFIIKTYLLDKRNEELYKAESVEHDTFFNEYQGSLLEYSSFIEKQYKTYNEIKKNTITKVRKTELIKTIIFSSSAFALIVMSILLLILEAGMPFQEKATRVFFIVMCILFTIASIGFAAYQVFKLLKDDSKDHGLESKFNKLNNDYLASVNENTYQYKIALYYGFLLKKAPFLKPYPVIRIDTEDKKKSPMIIKFVICGLGLISLVTVLSTHNIFVYKRVVFDIYDFSSASIKDFEWSTKKLPKNYRDIALIMGEYHRINKDLESISAFADKNNVVAHSLSSSSESYINSVTNIELNQTALSAFNNVQCFMYSNYDLTNKNKDNKYNWDFYPLLDEINLYYLINGKTLKEPNGGSGYLITTSTSYETNIGGETSGEFTYSFKNGVLSLYRYENQWVKKWTLSDFSFLSKTKAQIHAESTSGYSAYFEIDY